MALTSDWASKISSQTYLLEAKLLTRINSSIDITSQQDQNISQHSHSKISKENVCLHIETVWVPGENMASKWLKRQTLQLRFHQALRFKLTLHGPSVLQHLGIRTHHLSCHCRLQYILAIIISDCLCQHTIVYPVLIAVL